MFGPSETEVEKLGAAAAISQVHYQLMQEEGEGEAWKTPEVPCSSKIPVLFLTWHGLVDGNTIFVSHYLLGLLFITMSIKFIITDCSLDFSLKERLNSWIHVGTYCVQKKKNEPKVHLFK